MSISNALCAVSDWLDWFQDAHPTAAVVALTVLAVVGFTIAGTLE